jgi:hypothetical protein
MSNVTTKANAQTEKAAATQSGAELLVKNLEAQGVKYSAATSRMLRSLLPALDA